MKSAKLKLACTSLRSDSQQGEQCIHCTSYLIVPTPSFEGGLVI